MTNNGKNKSFSMTMNLENFFRYRRMPLPKRSAEFIALIAVSCTLFLFLHTKTLTSRLQEMEEKLQPSELSSTGLSENGALHNELMKPEMKGVHKTYQYLKSTGQMATLNSWDLNNTRRANIEVIFFNRVPKVGSQFFMELLRALSVSNGFQFHRDSVQRVELIRLGLPDQQELAELIADLPEPSVFIKHVCYTNFTKFNLPTPIYMNVVRDPIERVISWFYYVRAPWYFVERKASFPELPLPDPAWLKKDFETCVLTGDSECIYNQGATNEGIGDHRRQTLFFCGHSFDCLPFNQPGVLEKAKFSVESQYAVVGVLEDLNTTLSVLEKYIPKFFGGAKDIYYSNDRLSKVNRNAFKPPVSEEVKNIVRRNFTREIEFYQFCRQRLHKQFLAVNLPQRILH